MGVDITLLADRASKGRRANDLAMPVAVWRVIQRGGIWQSRMPSKSNPTSVPFAETFDRPEKKNRRVGKK